MIFIALIPGKIAKRSTLPLINTQFAFIDAAVEYFIVAKKQKKKKKQEEQEGKRGVLPKKIKKNKMSYNLNLVFCDPSRAWQGDRWPRDRAARE